MGEGKDIRGVTARFMRACDAVQKVLKAEGYDFMHDKNLGWILTCPSNLGTGLRAGSMGLQVRGTGGVDSASTGGTWDVSNADRIGKGEVDLVNTLIEGAAQLVKWETMYDNGKASQADAEIKARLK